MTPKQTILITLDCVRPDHLSGLGYKRKTSPALDRLINQSTVFTNCLASASFTHASIPAVFGMNYPLYTRLRFGLSESAPTISVRPDDFPLVQSVRKSGALAAGFTSNSFTSTAYMKGIDRNFDEFKDTYVYYFARMKELPAVSTKLIIDDAISFTRKHRKDDYFLWLHLMDAHGPYVPGIQPRFHPPKNGVRLARIIYKLDNEQYIDYVRGNASPGLPYNQISPLPDDDSEFFYDQNAEYYISKYDTGIAFMDAQLKRLFGSLENAGGFDPALIIIHADHGEALGEHNVFFRHGVSTTWEYIHVPLIMKLPRSDRGIRISRPVSLVSAGETIIKYHGHNEITGSLFRKDRKSGAPIYAFGPNHFSVLTHGNLYTVHNGGLLYKAHKHERLFPLKKNQSGNHAALPKTAFAIQYSLKRKRAALLPRIPSFLKDEYARIFRQTS